MADTLIKVWFSYWTVLSKYSFLFKWLEEFLRNILCSWNIHLICLPVHKSASRNRFRPKEINWKQNTNICYFGRNSIFLNCKIGFSWWTWAHMRQRNAIKPKCIHTTLIIMIMNHEHWTSNHTHVCRYI